MAIANALGEGALILDIDSGPCAARAAGVAPPAPVQRLRRAREPIQLRTGDVELEAGEMFVVPAGVEHCPRADEEALIMVIEPQETAASGDAAGHVESG
jgi:hypothetical protein